jgi:moderate conductance mechanosensitive channel
MQADVQELGDTLREAGARLRGFDWTEIVTPTIIIGSVRVVFILFLAFLAIRGLRVLTRRLQRDVDELDLVRKRLREQRAKTLASLLNNVGMMVVVGIALVTILNIFIPIGPILASIGILGLAISFGAQSLMKDLISGAFMLAEGQFAVGDVVRVGETSGLVEKITLRTLVLRDVHGVLHVIPNGTIDTLSNMTKSWSRAVLEIGVAYKEDVDRVMEVMLDEALRMYEDPDWAPILVDEPVVPGVERFDDSAVTIRVMFKTLPLKQWDTAREYRRRIKNRFDAEGIEIPFPHRTVYWGAGQEPAKLTIPHGSESAPNTGEPPAESRGAQP